MSLEMRDVGVDPFVLKPVPAKSFCD
jgi:hypothetical protein